MPDNPPVSKALSVVAPPQTVTQAHSTELPPIKKDPYIGIAAQPFSADAQKILTAPILASDVEVLPNGAVYLPEIKYRRRLNEAFGAGGWALLRTSEWSMQNATLSAEFRLYVNGRFVSEVRGEAEYIESNPNMTYASATEGAKSNALMRTCKDLGIASECWDPNFQHEWREKWAVQVWVEGKSSPQWRRKDRPAFYKEGEPVKPRGAANPDVRPQRKAAPASPPPPPAPETPPPSPPAAVVARPPVQEAPRKPAEVKGPPLVDMLIQVARVDTFNGVYKSGPNKGRNYTKYSVIAKDMAKNEVVRIDTFDPKLKEKATKWAGKTSVILAKVRMNGIFRDLAELFDDDDQAEMDKERAAIAEAGNNDPITESPEAAEVIPVCLQCGCVHTPDCNNGGEPPF